LPLPWINSTLDSPLARASRTKAASAASASGALRPCRSSAAWGGEVRVVAPRGAPPLLGGQAPGLGLEVRREALQRRVHVHAGPALLRRPAVFPRLVFLPAFQDLAEVHDLRKVLIRGPEVN
jgi:hypothetical protein